MADLRASRCEQLVDLVAALTVAVVSSNERIPQSFTDIVRAAEDVRAIAELGSMGVENSDYVAWAAGSPQTLNALIEAAEARDSKGVWEAFSHPQYGLHRVAAACNGLPRWAPPEGSEFV
jgi:hypothetical protein